MSDSPQEESARPAPAPAPESAESVGAAAHAAGGKSPSRGFNVAMLVALAALGVAAWQWYDGRSEIGALRQELAKKLADTDVQNKQSRLVAEQVREAMAEAQVKLGVLEGRL